MKVALVFLWTGLTILLTGCAVGLSPLDQEALSISVEDNLAAIEAEQVPVDKPIDLSEAVARALKYNLDHRVKEAEASLRVAELDLAHYSLLPKFAANAGYAERDPQAAASSFNLENNSSNFGSSTSQDKRITTAELTIGWNVLDFGLSYIRARQAADKALIAREMRKRMALRLVEEVRREFWRAVALDRLFNRLKQIDRQVWQQIRNNRAIVRSGETSPITALTAERELIELMRTLRSLQKDLSTARAKLAELMNIKPGTPFTLHARRTSPHSLRAPGTRREMLARALLYRAELRENIYRQRINRQEATAALLELLPGIQLDAGKQYDSNSFLLHNDWKSWGAKAAWNLLRVFQYPARRFVIDQQDKVLETQALALTMAIMTQVELSRTKLHIHHEDYRLANAHRSVQAKLLNQLSHERDAGRISGQEILRERLQLLITDVRRDVAYADLQNAHANLIATLGGDPLEDIDSGESVDHIAGILRGGEPATGGRSGVMRVASR